MSDAELLAHYAMPRLIKQESGGRAGVLGPPTKYGRAEGMTQMLPATAQATAKRIGVAWQPELMRGNTPEAAAYQEQLGRAYLQEGIEKTGDLKGGLKYYHGGPDTKQWGPKTNGYADAISADLGVDQPAPANDLAGLSDEELLAMYQGGPQAGAVTASVEGKPEWGTGVSSAPAAKPRPRAPAQLPQRQAALPNPTIAQDALSGLLQPLQTLGKDVVADYRRVKANGAAGPPKSFGEAISQVGGNLMAGPRIMGDILGLTGAPVQAAVRPIARAANRTGVPMYEKPKLADIGKGRAPQLVAPEQRQAVLEGAINTALSGARAASPREYIVPKPRAMSVDELRTAKTAAYDAVDKMGVAYDPQATAKLAADITADLGSKRINPKVTPKAHAVMEDIRDQLTSGQPVSLGQLDDMRQQVWRATGKGDDAEKFFGDRMREMIDGFVDNAGPAQIGPGASADAAAAIKKAREANRRYRNVQEVTNRTDSADLRAASTYAGGNKANATRQNLRPLIDPKSPQRLKGLAPAETKALNRAVRGTAGQNSMRLAGKVLDPRGLLGAAVQAVLGLPTHGLSAVTIPAGIAASEASNAMTAKAVADALKVLSNGGAGRPPLPPPLPPNPVALGSLPGLIGAGELAAPLARIPSESPRKAPARPARSKPRQR